MTGEMAWINPDGTDSNGEQWDIHANVAKRMRCKLRPFDKYIGPYIDHERGKVFIALEEDGTGSACLWPDGTAPAYREPIVCLFSPWNDIEAAVAAVREICRKRR